MYAINNTRYNLSVDITPNCLLHAVSPVTDFHTGVYNFYAFVVLHYFKYFKNVGLIRLTTKVKMNCIKKLCM
jgi:hypothetical protein